MTDTPLDPRLRSARDRALDTARVLPVWPSGCWHKAGDGYLQHLLKRRRQKNGNGAEPRARGRGWRAEP